MRLTLRDNLMCFLDDSVFNRVFACINAHELWKTIENHGGAKDLQEEKYAVLFYKLNILNKQ